MRRKFRSWKIRQLIISMRAKRGTAKIDCNANESTIRKIFYHDKFTNALEESSRMKHFIVYQESLSYNLSIRETEYGYSP